MPVFFTAEPPLQLLGRTVFVHAEAAATWTAQGGVAVDVQGFGGRLLSMDITYTKDEAASRGTFVFDRGTGSDSLSPAVSGSIWKLENGRPVLDVGNWLYLFVTIPSAGLDVRPFWMGRIDRVNATTSFGDRLPTVTVTCRDYGAVFLNGVIRYAYNENTTQPILARCRNIVASAWSLGPSIQAPNLDDLAALQGSVIEPVPTDWIMNPLLPQQPMSVMEACRRSVQTFGGDFRMVPQYGLDKICIVRPPRVDMIYDVATGRWVPQGLVSDKIFTSREYISVQELTWGDEDVRNQWEGWFRDETTGLPVGPVYREDTVSIEKYGPRYARVFLDRAEGITDVNQMGIFLDAALADSKDPMVSHKILLPFFPDVQLDDVHTYQANGQDYDYDLQLTVVAITHHWEATPGVMATTTIGGRAVGIGAYREYRRSKPPAAFATTLVPTTEYAEEGTVIMVTDDLSP